MIGVLRHTGGNNGEQRKEERYPDGGEHPGGGGGRGRAAERERSRRGEEKERWKRMKAQKHSRRTQETKERSLAHAGAALRARWRYLEGIPKEQCEFVQTRRPLLPSAVECLS
jgi:hypothetical protein